MYLSITSYVSLCIIYRNYMCDLCTMKNNNTKSDLLQIENFEIM